MRMKRGYLVTGGMLVSGLAIMLLTQSDWMLAGLFLAAVSVVFIIKYTFEDAIMPALRRHTLYPARVKHRGVTYHGLFVPAGRLGLLITSVLVTACGVGYLFSVPRAPGETFFSQLELLRFIIIAVGGVVLFSFSLRPQGLLLTPLGVLVCGHATAIGLQYPLTYLLRWEEMSGMRRLTVWIDTGKEPSMVLVSALAQAFGDWRAGKRPVACFCISVTPEAVRRQRLPVNRYKCGRAVLVPLAPLRLKPEAIHTLITHFVGQPQERYRLRELDSQRHCRHILVLAALGDAVMHKLRGVPAGAAGISNAAAKVVN